MEHNILLYYIRYLSGKAADPTAVYADEALAQGILAYIREENIVGTIEQAGISEAALPFYLDMRLARFRDMPYDAIRYFFCNRGIIAEIESLVAWFRENPDAPAEQRRTQRLRLRELCAGLGPDSTSRRIAREALYEAEAGA